MTAPVIQNSFISGELSPSVIGRTDRPQYRNGASTMRNAFVRYTGGASSRAGLAFCGMCKQDAPNIGGTSTKNPPRIIEFQYSINQGFSLEFGDQYMRILSQGAYVTEANETISGITQANPAVINIGSHGYSVGDWIFISNVTGMTNFNGLTWIVTDVVDSNHIQVSDLFGDAINSTLFNAYISGGTAARLYTVIAPYAAVDLPYLKFTQSANTMSLCCINTSTLADYSTYDLQRFGATNWQFTAVTFAASIGPPQTVTATAAASTTKDTWYFYVVTAISAAVGDESIASSVVEVENNDISINAGSNTISWSSVPGAASYNIYTATPSYQSGTIFPGVPYGYIGTSTGTNFVDTNIIADFTTSPPIHNNPFASIDITGIIPTAGGSGYTAANIGYQLNTTTGTGFIGNPTVNSAGNFSGFNIVSGGENFALTDTITILSSGSTNPAAATGTLTFSLQPQIGSTLTLNGVVVTFTGPGDGPPMVGGTLAITLSNLVDFLNSDPAAGISVASYSVSGSVVTITYKTVGTGGNAYTLVSSGTSNSIVSGTTLTGGVNAGGGGSGAAAVLTFGDISGNNPACVAYFQQRRVYASTLNEPDTYFMSKPGAFTNMDAAIPTLDSDAIVGTPWAQQINGIQFFQPTINGLLTFTGNGVWNVNGGNSLAITPSDQNAQAQAQVGCSPIVPPLYVNLHVLYVQSKNSIVRDVSYNFIYNVFQGTDITLWSNHLFQNYSILQWAYAEEPFKLIWAVRNDGILLSLTYLKEEEIEGWTRHDTNGLFISTCVVTEKALAAIDNPSNFGPLVDAPYFITQRYITGRGVWAYYSERMDDRNWANIEDCFCVDAGLSWPTSYPQAVLSPVAANGTANITSTLLINGGTGMTAPTAIAVDSTGAGTGATFTVSFSGGTITAVTPVLTGENYTAGATQIIISDPTGSGAVVQAIITNYVTFNASASVFIAAMIGDIIRADNGKATIISQTGTACVADITQPLTITMPNDPNNLPVPVPAGQWSVTTPTMVVSGLNHLEGMTVTGLADGGVITPVEVVNGSITLPQPASAIVVGLPFIAQVQTMQLEVPAQTTTQGKRANISSAILKVENSRGLQVGANQPDASMQPNQATIPWSNMQEIKQRNMFVNAGAEIPLFSGNTEPINVTSDYDDRKQLSCQQIYPMPMNLLACIPEIVLGDANG